jgi:hypothetical protein
VRRLSLVLALVVLLGGLAVLVRTRKEDPPALAPAATNAITVPVASTPEPVPPGAVSVYPSPGVTTASPETQISFRGKAPDKLGKITVTGSESGPHKGRIEAHSDGQGASFLPAKRFRQGEKVTVKTSLEIAGAKHGRFSITIANEMPKKAIRDQPPPSHGRGATVKLASRPDLIAPAVTITAAKSGRAAGDVFVAPKGGRGQDGPMIVDDGGKLVWFKPMPQNDIATDFRVQTYQGKPVLTWWQGGLIVGDGRGDGVIYDDRYRKLKTVHAGNGYSMDLHEFTITPQDTALVVAYNRVDQDLRPLGGPDHASAIDGVVQEIDIKTGLVLFEWHSIGSVGLDESKAKLPKHPGGEYDYMHLNSVALDGADDLIVSARNTWAVYDIDRATAKIAWRLGGTKSTIKVADGASTAWQHDALPQDDGTLTIFDNGSSPPIHKASRALTVKVDAKARTAKLVSAISHPGRTILSSTQGSVQELGNGDAFVGYGSQRYFSEYSPTGKLLFDGELARGNDTYRAFRFKWDARPAAPPDVAATVSGGELTAHASWNGATGIARWQLLAGASKASLKPVGEAASAGFETTLKASASARLVAVRALGADGGTLGTSAPIKPHPTR